MHHVFKLVKHHRVVPQNQWDNLLWTDEVEASLLEQSFIFKSKRAPPLSKPHSNNGAWWRKDHDYGPGSLAVTEQIINSNLCQDI